MYITAVVVVVVVVALVKNCLLFTLFCKMSHLFFIKMTASYTGSITNNWHCQRAAASVCSAGPVQTQSSKWKARRVHPFSMIRG